jgi:hypothetical protein
MSVDFPEPEGPVTATYSPGPIVRVSEWRASTVL